MAQSFPCARFVNSLFELLLIVWKEFRKLKNILHTLNVSGLWNHIFLFSNLSLFVLLPFAYFFIESEGFAGHRKVDTIIIQRQRNSAKLLTKLKLFYITVII